MRRGMGDPITTQDVSTSTGPMSTGGVSSLPWYCFIPGYAMLSPDQCNVFGQATPIPAPPAPGIPAGSLDPNQNPVLPGDPAQTVQDVVTAQGQAWQQKLSAFMGGPSSGCAASDFWCNYGAWVALAGVGIGAFFVFSGRGRRR